MDNKDSSLDLDIFGGDIDPHIVLAISIFDCIYKNIPTKEGKAEFREATSKARDEIVGKVVDFIRASSGEEVTLH